MPNNPSNNKALRVLAKMQSPPNVAENSVGLPKTRIFRPLRPIIAGPGKKSTRNPCFPGFLVQTRLGFVIMFLDKNIINARSRHG